jgi:hypothetical protein
MYVYICIRYSTIDTKEADRNGYSCFFFRIRTQVMAEVRYCIKHKLNFYLGHFLHNLCSELTSMWTFKMNSRNTKTTNEPTATNNKSDRPIFTLLMFRKPNKTTINKNKTTHFYRSTSFRLSFIFRYFKVFQVKRIVYNYYWNKRICPYWK